MKKTIRIADSWDDITLSQYQEIAQLDIEDSNKKMIEIISIITNEDPEIIKKMDVASLSAVLECLEWTNKSPDDAVYKPIIKVGDNEYGFINNLTDLTVGEWIDLEHYIADIPQYLDKIIATLYRPLITAVNDKYRILEPYDSNKVEMIANEIKDVIKITEVYGVVVFFWNTVNASLPIIQDSLIQIPMTKKMIMKQMLKKILKVINGIGTALFTDWQKETLRKLRAYSK
jgi:hypothetical protein